MTGSVGGIGCDTVGGTILKSLRGDDLKAAVVEDFIDLEQVKDLPVDTGASYARKCFRLALLEVHR